MEVSNTNVAGYYDSFTEKQLKTGINIRHRTIFKNLKQNGLRINSNVLEIGCGIGTVTNLICSHCRQGNVVGVDISEKSILLARKLNSTYKNAEFIVSDMSDFRHEKKFDFVVLPDVLEHIPVEQHAALFQTIDRHCSPEATVLINIPHPLMLDWLRVHRPEALQIIDQSLCMKDLVTVLDKANFNILSLTPYSLQYTSPEYFSIVFKRKIPYSSVKRKSVFQLFISNLIAKLS